MPLSQWKKLLHRLKIVASIFLNLVYMLSGYLVANRCGILLNNLFEVFDRRHHSAPIFRLEDITNKGSLPAAMETQNTLHLELQDVLIQRDYVGIELFFQPSMIGVLAGSRPQYPLQFDVIANATSHISKSTLISLCGTMRIRQQGQDNADTSPCHRRFWRCLDSFTNEVFDGQNPACSLGQALLNICLLALCTLQAVFDDNIQVLLAICLILLIGRILARIIFYLLVSERRGNISKIQEGQKDSRDSKDRNYSPIRSLCSANNFSYSFTKP